MGVDVTPDGGLLAMKCVEIQSSNSSEVVNIFDFKTGRRLNQLPLKTEGNAHLSPDGKYLSFVSDTGGAIYALPSLERIGEFKEYFRDQYRALKPAFAGNIVALPIGMQNRIRLWNTSSRNAALFAARGSRHDLLAGVESGQPPSVRRHQPVY